MTDSTLIELSKGTFNVAINPKAGASIAQFKTTLTGSDVNVMSPLPKHRLSDSTAAHASMYPILPYVGKIHGGSFLYWGIKRTIPRTPFRGREPFDGDGWRHEWQVTSKSSDSVELYFVNNSKANFPFSYESFVTYTLTDTGLEMHISLRNIGAIPMPCALGVHSVFPKGKDAVIQFQNKNVWEYDNNPVHDNPFEAPEEWQFSQGKSLDKMVINACFGGFDGNAEISWPDRNLRLKIKALDEFHHAILSVARTKDTFTFRPVTSAIDAFNLAATGIVGTGIKSIGPGEVIKGQVTFTVEKIG